MRCALLVALTLPLSGCLLFFTGDDDDDKVTPPPQCDPAPALRLVNPETLACQTVYTDTCGELGTTYVPAWGECSSTCIYKTETECMAAPECRVARGYADYYESFPVDDYLGCYPLGTAPPPPVEPSACADLAAEACSNRADCTALYEGTPGNCGSFLTPEQCAGAQFRGCIDEDVLEPGYCTSDTNECATPPPNCPAFTRPGILDGCFTGACIPDAFCAIDS